jgi:hypothetical protein
MASITRYEPEVIAVIAERHYRGNREQVPTTALKMVMSYGVMLSSRYQKAEELELMSTMVEFLPPGSRSQIAAIWCVSRPTRTFVVTLRNGSVEAAAADIGAGLEAASGGHNGIAIRDIRGKPICMFGANRSL